MGGTTAHIKQSSFHKQSMRIPLTTERAYTAAAGCIHITNTSETKPFNAARFSILVNLCGHNGPQPAH